MKITNKFVVLLQKRKVSSYFLPTTKSMRIFGLEDANSARAFWALLATSSSCNLLVSEKRVHFLETLF